MPGFIAVILIGIIVGFVARLLYPGPNTVHGFVVTALLGVAGAGLATFCGRYIGLIGPHKLAHPIGMVAGAMFILFVWNRLAALNVVRDPGIHHEENKAKAAVPAKVKRKKALGQGSHPAE
jgi:uncharacterized membrane protein YeaQ/YmgE (transglycosylase-associated protein family)